MIQKDKLPKCNRCWDKGYSTQFYGTHGSPDFVGDKGFDEQPDVHKVFCSCDRGRMLEKLEKKR